jgi:tRNA (adenine37-N6)-methyltransferase
VVLVGEVIVLKGPSVKLFWILCLLFPIPIIGGCQVQTRAVKQTLEPGYYKIYTIGKVEKKEGRTYIVLDKKYIAGLKGLEKLSSVQVVYWFDQNNTPEQRAILQVHPKGDMSNPLTGVFATHSPFRPNLIAISKCEIIAINKNVIEIKDIDAFEGSPVLDLKGDFLGSVNSDTQ